MSFDTKTPILTRVLSICTDMILNTIVWLSGLILQLSILLVKDSRYHGTDTGCIWQYFVQGLFVLQKIFSLRNFD